MRFRVMTAISLVVLAVTVAGCGGGGSKGSSTGSIEGYVMSAQSDGGVVNETALADVQVTVSGVGTFVYTDAAGYFRVDGIAPGTQTVAFALDGLPSTPFNVNVSKGRVASLGKRYYGEPGRKLDGRVVIQGSSPNRNLMVTVYVDGTPYVVSTDSQGRYSFPPYFYSVGDALSLEVSSSYNYTAPTAKSMGLNSWTFTADFDAVSGVFTVPTLDLYSYTTLLYPTTSVSLPATISITDFSSGRLSPYYWLYFYDLDDYYIGQTSVFWDTTFPFSGSLKEGRTLAEDAVWYLGNGYEDSGIDVEANQYGREIQMGVVLDSIRAPRMNLGPIRDMKQRR